MSILHWLGVKPKESASASEKDVLGRVSAALDGLPPERARFLAVFAFVLSRVAYADLEISEAETRQMERILQEYGGLPAEQARRAVAVAQAENQLHGATGNYLATRELRALCTTDEKLTLLRCLFAVSAADDSISTVEEEAIRQIGNELGLTREEYVAIRGEFREKRAVLRDPTS
jgi:uncharacterized tellurite resistance protein B-like protein